MKRGFLAIACLTMFGGFSILQPAYGSQQNHTIAVVDASGSIGTFASISSAIEAGYKNIYVENGIYQEDISIHIPGITITGQSQSGVVIQGPNPHKDVVGVYADNVTVSNLTIDARTNHAQAAFVTGNASHVALKNCHIIGSDNIFAVYFAGGDYASDADLLASVENPSQGHLDSDNVMQGNTIETTLFGDGVSFSVQNHGVVKDNTIIGSRIAFYMNDNSICSDNTITNSVNNGIFYSVPAMNNVIENNTITHTQGSAIVVRAEEEHPAPSDYLSPNLTIRNNKIDDTRYMGIEITQLKDSLIEGNQIDDADFIGIYGLRSDNLKVIHNQIGNIGLAAIRGTTMDWSQSFDSDVFFDAFVTNSVVAGNWLANDSQTAKYGVRINSGSGNTNNMVEGNRIIGTFTAQAYMVP